MTVTGEAPARFSYTWDDLATVVGVIDLAARDGVYMPGTSFEWRHTWIPLTAAAAKSHGHGKVPKGWHAPSGGGEAKPEVGLGMRVRVTSGYHAGEQGHVVALDDKSATIEDASGARRTTLAALLQPTSKPGKAVTPAKAPEPSLTDHQRQAGSCGSTLRGWARGP